MTEVAFQEYMRIVGANLLTGLAFALMVFIGILLLKLWRDG